MAGPSFSFVPNYSCPGHHGLSEVELTWSVIIDRHLPQHRRPLIGQPHLVSRRQGYDLDDYISVWPSRVPVWLSFEIQQYGKAQDTTDCQSRRNRCSSPCPPPPSRDGLARRDEAIPNVNISSRSASPGRRKLSVFVPSQSIQRPMRHRLTSRPPTRLSCSPAMTQTFTLMARILSL